MQRSDTCLFKFAEAEIWQRGDRYFVRYDAGNHVSLMREDEVSQAEAELASSSKEQLLALLWAVQKRLLSEGNDPYRSNLP